MSFPAELSNAMDGVTEVVAAHLNNLEAKVGIDNSAVATSLDYLLKNAGSIDPGHKHSKLWASDGSPEAVTVDAAGVATFAGIPLGPGSNPTADNQLARKAYVDLMLPLAGGTMAGNMAMNNHKVTGLAAASGSGEALRYDEWIATQDPGHKHSKLWASDGSPEAVTVDAAGNVGFGISPSTKLHINGNILVSSTNSISFNALGGEYFYSPTTGVLGYVSRGAHKYWADCNNNDGDVNEYEFYMGEAAGSGTPKVVIRNNGNVGFGNTSPGYLLTMEASGGGYYSASDHSWHNGSSIRWKENPTPIAQSLDLVKQLTGVRFHWKNSGIPGIGLIAEDVLKIVPEVVMVDKENPGFCNGINYGSMIGLLIEAIKEQQFQIEGIKAKLN